MVVVNHMFARQLKQPLSSRFTTSFPSSLAWSLYYSSSQDEVDNENEKFFTNYSNNNIYDYAKRTIVGCLTRKYNVTS